MTAPQQYQVQFSTVEEHAQLIERARALLSRERAGMTLGELHLEAMRLLVASLEKRKFANEGPARRSQPKREAVPEDAPRQRGAERDQSVTEPPRQRGAKPKVTKGPSSERSRYIPAPERREAYRRDGGRCTYVDAHGERCCETRWLELHHLQPFAPNGPNAAANLTLRWRAHNALAAEEDFGRELIATRRDSQRHERRSAQLLAGADRLQPRPC